MKTNNDNQENKLLSKIFSYENLLNYQEDTVASRTIIDKKAGTVTVFAFDAGQRLSTHSAPFDALVQIIDGKALIKIEDKEFELKAGEQIIMPANKPHSVAAPEKFKMVLVMIKSN